MSCGVAREVADHLVDAVHADGREVVGQPAGQVALRVREEPVLDVPVDHLALELERVARELEQVVEGAQQAVPVAAVQVPEPRAVDGHHAERPGLLGRPEQPVAPLEQLAQVQLQPAAHRADLAGLEVGVQEVLEVGQAVLGGHREQPVGVLRVPVEVGRDVVRRDREREHPARRVALGHDLDVRAVDHRHLDRQVAVREVHRLAADERDLVAQVVGAGPVERQVGERRLRAPARRHVQVVHELLHQLADLVVAAGRPSARTGPCTCRTS